MLIWVFILLAVIVFVGFSQGTSPFQSNNNHPTPTSALTVNFKQSGQLYKTLNDSWSFVYQDKNKTSVKIGLVFNEKSQCGTKDNLGICDQKLFKADDKVTIEGSQKDQTVTVVKLTK